MRIIIIQAFPLDGDKGVMLHYDPNGFQIIYTSWLIVSSSENSSIEFDWICTGLNKCD